MTSAYHVSSQHNKEDADVLITKTSNLESILRTLNEASGLSIEYFSPNDAILLKCTQLRTILRQLQGTLLDEQQQQQQEPQHQQEEGNLQEEDAIFGITRFYQQHVDIDDTTTCTNTTADNHDCTDLPVCVTFLETLDSRTWTSDSASQCSIPRDVSTAENVHHVTFVDATHRSIPKTLEETYYMLRTLLRCSKCCRVSNDSSNSICGCQCASPWSLHHQEDTHHHGPSGETTVCLLLPFHQCDQDRDSDEEDQESLINQFFAFRVGDAAPSFYLHCAVPMVVESKTRANTVKEQLVQYISNPTRALHRPFHRRQNHPQDRRHDQVVLAMVYRQIPPRFHLQPNPRQLDDLIPDHRHDTTIDDDNSPCTTTTESEDGHATSTRIRVTPLWEAFIPPQPEDEQDTNNVLHHPSVGPVLYRRVAPPYVDLSYYRHLLQHFLEPHNFRALQEEATNIPQWTPWPEQQHYDTQSGSDWTVFPLCHTFPAHDATKRKWIQSTCSFCPRTVQMLVKDNCLQTTLRTALLSRLGPRTTLAPHSGWSDLANHVLRIHIPLIVPKGDSDDRVSCCGTWVDGCVMLHEEGVIQVFDDSKVHRAFNYSGSEERIVLIVDLERPNTLPLGTAVGGHTEELDAFINEML